MTRYRSRDPREAPASDRGRRTETRSPIRRQALPWRSLRRQSACDRNRGQGAICGESSGRYADIGIKSIMPTSVLCRADVKEPVIRDIPARPLGIIRELRGTRATYRLAGIVRAETRE